MLWLPAAESGPQMGRAVEKQVRWFWRFVMMPLLFGLVGTSINLKTLDKSIIPRACAIVVSGQTLQDSSVTIACWQEPGQCCLMRCAL